jgi:hypothetical protein
MGFFWPRLNYWPRWCKKTPYEANVAVFRSHLSLCEMLPMCASWKKIRDDKGYWTKVEVYIREHSEADFSHSICPDCASKLYPDFYSGSSYK